MGGDGLGGRAGGVVFAAGTVAWGLFCSFFQGVAPVAPGGPGERHLGAADNHLVKRGPSGKLSSVD